MNQNSKSNRNAFTLVELLVVIAVMAILAGMMTYAMAGARQEAREKRARAEIEAMSAIIMQKMNEIYLQPIAFAPRARTSNIAAITPGDEVRSGDEHNRVIMLARRDLARMALPQCRADLLYPPARLQYRLKTTTSGGSGATAGAVKIKEPSEWGEMRRLARFGFPRGSDIESALNNPSYPGHPAPPSVFGESAADPMYGANGYFVNDNLRRRLGAMRDDGGTVRNIDLADQNAEWLADTLSDESNIPWTREYESAECLYLILATTQMLGERAIDQFSSRMIANLDGDAVPEIVDPWGVPYEFIREATGFGAPFDITINSSHPAGSDGNDFLRTDFRYRRLTPANTMDDPYRTIPLIVSAGTDGEFGIRTTYSKAGDISDGSAGISPAASISTIRLTTGSGSNLPNPRAPDSYQYPDPFVSLLPDQDVTSPIAFGDLSTYTIRTWTGAALGLGAVIDRDAATDNIYSTRTLGLNQ